VIDAFVEALDLHGMGFSGVAPKETGRPSYHPSVLLKLDLWLSQSGPVQPATRTRGWTQCRGDVARGPACA
jgi:hypothetical protein